MSATGARLSALSGLNLWTGGWCLYGVWGDRRTWLAGSPKAQWYDTAMCAAVVVLFALMILCGLALLRRCPQSWRVAVGSAKAGLVCLVALVVFTLLHLGSAPSDRRELVLGHFFLTVVFAAGLVNAAVVRYLQSPPVREAFRVKST